MRRVEQKILGAIRERRALTVNNTSVTAPDADGVQRVTLFGNLIAKVYSDYIEWTFAGWPTSTTRSRLNALLSLASGNPRVWLDKGEPHARIPGVAQDVVIDAYGWQTAFR